MHRLQHAHAAMHNAREGIFLQLAMLSRSPGLGSFMNAWDRMGRLDRIDNSNVDDADDGVFGYLRERHGISRHCRRLSPSTFH